jgi:hypothetical protein
MVATKVKNRISRPQNCIFAKAYPPIVDVRTMKNVDTPANINEFQKNLRKGQSLNTLTKFSKVGSIGRNLGGQINVSGFGLNEVASIHKMGKIDRKAPNNSKVWRITKPIFTLLLCLFILQVLLVI